LNLDIPLSGDIDNPGVWAGPRLLTPAVRKALFTASSKLFNANFCALRECYQHRPFCRRSTAKISVLKTHCFNFKPKESNLNAIARRFYKTAHRLK